MNVAVLGAGALGQPFGYHLSEGGADLTFVVKEKYREETEEGFTLHRHHMLGATEALEFDDFDVVVDYDRLGEQEWDQLWLCVSSPAIRGEWIEELLEAVGETTLVSIQPGIDDREYLEERYPAERIVSGRVSMIAYPTPLPGEDLPEGDIAYFLPPGERIWLGGEAERAGMVAEVLEAGGCPSGVREDLREYMLFSGALLETVVAGLEVAGWSLKGFRQHEIFEVALQAGREARDVVAARFDTTPPLSMKLAGGSLTMRLGLMLAPGVMPFDLEAYLERHFTKVSDQTREELEAFIESGRSEGLEVEALEQLRASLD